MHLFLIYLFVICFYSSYCFAVEVEEAIKTEQTESVPRNAKKGDFSNEQGAKSSHQPSKNITRVIPSRSKPQKVSLEEYFEYGMVPVEDLEAQLSEGAVAATRTLGVHKGKYYTVYSKVSGGGGDSGSSDSASESEFENIEFTEDEEESEDDERE